MRFYYLDPGLKSNVGHHANSCRMVTSELRRRGIETLVAGAAALIPELKSELGAIPFFGVYTYAPPHPDPIAGWLKTFLDGVAATTNDLARLPATTSDDVVFLNSAQPIQFMAALTWLNGITPTHRPRLVIEFGADPGVKLRLTDKGYTLEAVDPRVDSRSVLFRHVAKNIPAEFHGNLFLTTFDAGASKVYQSLLEYETGVLPLAQQSYGPLRQRAGTRPITIGILGHQRVEKGYQLVPEVIEALLAQHKDIQFLVQSAEPQEMAITQEKIRKLAQADPRIVLDERPADAQRWAELISRTDLILCPYLPIRYMTSYSAIAVEALANGIPIVAPAGTTLQWFTDAHRGAIVPFGQFEPAQILAAVSKAVSAYDDSAARAFAAAEAWNRQDRKALLVDAILGLRPSVDTGGR